ncbi:protein DETOXIFICATION 48-like [Vigna radiata var. radiata]|uniref:Protein DETOXIFICATION 48-like n=1 Tax=Vigna radiata var. radiata TaxID=3916 RepID=A0A1S3UB82_VIGRR|nr:protein DETOXIFICATION 48-like [Vigna radiata var. radiata]
MGVSGVAIAMVWTNINLFLFLSSFVYFSSVYEDSWVPPNSDCLCGWSSLLALAVPTCISVCLDWWWYELMIILCALLLNPEATIASMGYTQFTTTPTTFQMHQSMHKRLHASGNESMRGRNECSCGEPNNAPTNLYTLITCSTNDCNRIQHRVEPNTTHSSNPIIAGTEYNTHRTEYNAMCNFL